MEKLRIVFMGSPEIAVPALKALAGQYNVVGVVTQPDREAGPADIIHPYGFTQDGAVCACEYHGRDNRDPLSHQLHRIAAGDFSGGDGIMCDLDLIQYCSPTLAGMKCGSAWGNTTR